MLDWLRNKLTPQRSADGAEDHPSVVVLLRNSQWLAQDQALQIGQKAWGARDQVEMIQTLNNGSTLRSSRWPTHLCWPHQAPSATKSKDGNR